MSDIRIKTAGHSVNDRLLFGSGYHACGHIKDGVCFQHMRNSGEWGGGWVLAFRDLERMYLAAKAYRAKNKNVGVDVFMETDRRARES